MDRAALKQRNDELAQKIISEIEHENRVLNIVFSASGISVSVLELKPDVIFYQQPWYINPKSAIELTSPHALTAYMRGMGWDCTKRTWD